MYISREPNCTLCKNTIQTKYNYSKTTECLEINEYLSER